MKMSLYLSLLYICILVTIFIQYASSNLRLTPSFSFHNRVTVDVFATGVKLYDRDDRSIELVDNDGQLVLKDTSNTPSIIDFDTRPYLGIFGIFKLPMGHYIALISGADPVDCNTINDLYSVKALEFVRIPTKHNEINEKLSQQQREAEQLLITTLQRHSFIFSKGQYDVTKSLQGNLINSIGKLNNNDNNGNNDDNNNNNKDTLLYDDRFFWNINCNRWFLEAGLSSYITPVTNAFITSSEIQCVDNKKYYLTLISRRNRNRQGPRYIKRGSDVNGNVANFVETEQILSNEDGTHVSSFVQVRGSIPLFWQQHSSIWKRRATPKLVTENLVTQVKVLQKHLGELFLRYCPVLLDARRFSESSSNKISIYFINLIDKIGVQGTLGYWLYKSFKNLKLTTSSTDEDRTSSSLEDNKVLLNRDEVTAVDFENNFEDSSYETRYIWFDYHNKCKDGNMKSCETDLFPLLSKAIDGIEGGYCTVELEKSTNGNLVKSLDTMKNNAKRMRLQNKIIRTNCMDCLDRTNVVQSMISKWVFNQQLNSLNEQKQNMNLMNESIENILRRMWSKHGDHLSYMYAGSRAMKREVTKSGKQTYRGAISDGVAYFQRYFTNNYLDKRRQLGLDYLLGNTDSTGKKILPSPSIASIDDCSSCNSSSSSVSNYSSGFAVWL